MHRLRKCGEQGGTKVAFCLLDRPSSWYDGSGARMVQDPPKRELAKGGRGGDLTPAERTLVDCLQVLDGRQRNVAQVLW